MDLQYSPEQVQLGDIIDRVVREEYDFDTRRDILAAGGFSETHWMTFAELGWLAVPFAEADGGLGGNAVDLGLVLQGIGRGLVLEPVLPTLLGGLLIADLGGPEQKKAWLERVIAGQLRLAVALSEPGNRSDLGRSRTQARAEGDGWRLTGHKSVVPGADRADMLLVPAADATGGLSLFAIPAETAGLSLRSYPTHDGTGAADLILDDVALPGSALIGPAGGALGSLERNADLATAALCAEAAGAMAVLVETTLDYLKMRRQFGQPLSTNQALQHRMVDMMVALEEARASALAAALRMEAPDPAERARAVSLAKLEINRTARLVGQEAIQLHGAVGMTDELAASHYFKRLTAITQSGGTTIWHQDRIARLDAEARQARALAAE